MAEKDERIEISKYDLSNTEWNGDCQIDIDKVYTRQEAIERMAKALYVHQYQNMPPRWEDDDNGYREIYLKRAEAALNALLEGK